MSKASDMVKAYKNIYIGMDKRSVMSMIGEPDSVKVRGNVEIWGWFNSEFKGIFRGGRIERRMTVEFEDGKVIGYDGENMGVSTL